MQIYENDKVGFVNRSGKYIITPKFKSAHGFSDGLAGVQVPGSRIGESDDLWGFIDEKGKLVIPPIPIQFGATGNFSEGLAAVATTTENGWKYGYINYRGEWVIQPIFDHAYDFSDGLGAVEIDDKWGYIDRTGKWVIEPQYDDIFIPYTNGLGYHSIKTEKGYIYAYMNRKGEIVWQKEIVKQ